MLSLCCVESEMVIERGKVMVGIGGLCRDVSRVCRSKSLKMSANCFLRATCDRRRKSRYWRSLMMTPSIRQQHFLVVRSHWLRPVLKYPLTFPRFSIIDSFPGVHVLNCTSIKWLQRTPKMQNSSKVFSQASPHASLHGDISPIALGLAPS